MAGRAGRRGLDSFGMVILPAFEDVPEEADIKARVCSLGGLLDSRRSEHWSCPAAFVKLLMVPAAALCPVGPDDRSGNAAKVPVPPYIQHDPQPLACRGECLGSFIPLPSSLAPCFRLETPLSLWRAANQPQDLTVEDMLRRSFAEFHAQKAAPEQARQIRLLEGALEQLRSKPFPGCLSGCTKEAVTE